MEYYNSYIFFIFNIFITMCGNENCNCNISYEVLTRATNVKNFTDAYTLSNDWHLEDRVFYNDDDNYQPVSEPPTFLNNRNLCGVFDLSAKITIKNNSNQDITNPQIILPTIFSNYITVNENDFYYYVYENQNFLILFQHTSDSNAQNPNITVYSQESNGDIEYNGEQSNIEGGILRLDDVSLNAKMSCIINFNIHVYVKNHSNDFSFTTLFYGLVGSAKKCSCCCLKQTKLPIVDNSVIELDYDSDCC